MKINEIKKKNGTIVYRANVYLGTDQVTGKKVKTNVTGRTKKEVKQKAKEAEIEFKANGSTRFQETNIKTFKELSDLWLSNYKLTVKPQSYRYTVSLLNNHIWPKLGSMKPHKITTVYLQAFINDLAPKLVHFSTVHSVVTRIIQFGVILQLLPFNPAREVMLPKGQKETRERVKFIDNTDLRKLLDHMDMLSQQEYKYYFDSVLYKLLLATGCRFGEVVALDWSDIDLDNKTISISKSYNRLVDLVGTPKSKAGIRVISIDNKTVLMLKQYQGRQRLTFLDIGEKAPSVVFATPVRTYQSMQIMQQRLTKRCEEIGITYFTFHAFRHTHASLLLNAGISYKELQYRLGHSQLSMTMDIYSHLSKDKEKEAVRYFEKALESL